jgi:hypothetical protein
VITQAELKNYVYYDPDTGAFTRKEKPARGKAKAGDVMGSRHMAGYMAASVRNKAYLLHRLAWLYVHGYMPEQIDHINHDRTDNRISNLREVVPQENLRNQKLSAANTSGVTGVAWDKAKRKWMAQVKVDYRNVHLGRYDDWFDAVCARKSANNRFGFHENHGRAA